MFIIFSNEEIWLLNFASFTLLYKNNSRGFKYMISLCIVISSIEFVVRICGWLIKDFVLDSTKPTFTVYR